MELENEGRRKGGKGESCEREIARYREIDKEEENETLRPTLTPLPLLLNAATSSLDNPYYHMKLNFMI